MAFILNSQNNLYKVWKGKLMRRNTMKSVLMIGQSNMAVRGFIDEVPMICNERIQMLRK